jgi:putative hydrolase of the HAD superfamily
MSKITTVFFDVGGVLLTNGWDHESRKLAAAKFQFDWDEFEKEHDKLADALDTGMISMSIYLDKVLFYKERPYTKAEFYEFMKEQSVLNAEALAVASKLSAQKRYLLSTLNNESTDLNLFRIEKFGLGAVFQLFLSSCYLGVKKPDPAIFIRALLLTNKRPEETIFIDDRLANLEAPKHLGMTTIQFINAEQLTADLAAHGVAIDANG